VAHQVCTQPYVAIEISGFHSFAPDRGFVCKRHTLPLGVQLPLVIQLPQRSKRFLRSRWFLPTLHIVLFGITWVTALVQSQALLDGAARWGFGLLFVADFPISLVAFSWMWDGRTAEALSFWGILGTRLVVHFRPVDSAPSRIRWS
jgi:hypothetical protein